MQDRNEAGSGSSVARTTTARSSTQRPGDRRVELLVGDSPVAILERITPGDPLELEELSFETTLARAVLLDPFRVYLRALARTAHDAYGRRHVARPHLHGWLVGRVERVIEELIDEESEPHHLEAESDPYYEHVSTVLGLPLARARSLCAAFNRLDERVRQAFFSVTVDGQTAEQCAAEGLGSYAQIQADLARARQTLELT